MNLFRRVLLGGQGGAASLQQRIRLVLGILIAVCCAISLVIHERLLPSRIDNDYAGSASSFSSLNAPENIWNKGTVWRPQPYRADEVFPRIHKSVTLQLASIPRQHRLPSTAISNVTAYFLASPQHVAPWREYFFDYNPSIVRIPVDQIPPSVPDAVYLVSARVSNLNYCFHPEDRQRMMMNHHHDNNNHQNVKPKDWLGLALLTDDWQLRQDVVVDLAAVLRGAQDFRLLVLPNDHHDHNDVDATMPQQRQLSQQLYISSNDVLLPIWLKKPFKNLEEGTNTIPTKTLPVIFPATATSSAAGQEEHENMSIWVPSETNAYIQCAPCGKTRQCGKNFHFFSAAMNHSNNEKIDRGQQHHHHHHQQQSLLWAEIWPSAPHLIRSVEPPPCRRDMEPTHTFAVADSPKASFRNHEVAVMRSLSATNNEEANMKRRADAPSWLTRGRGSACCLPIRHPGTGAALFMGIAHSKTLGKQQQQPNHYLSTLYAFEDTPPFSLVAQSGYFCLAFPLAADDDDDDESSPGAMMVNVTRWRVLKLGEQLVYPDCPRIHFVSGMTLDARDPSKVIIAYGINDCVSRLIQVNLADLVKLLFYGPL